MGTLSGVSEPVKVRKHFDYRTYSAQLISIAFYKRCILDFVMETTGLCAISASVIRRIKLTTNVWGSQKAPDPLYGWL